MRRRNHLIAPVSYRVQGSANKITPWMPGRCHLLLLLAMLFASPAWPQQKAADLTGRSIEDLMNIEVTSVSKKEQKMSQAAAAIFVITQEDIHRSGATNIPDLLRMVPGLDVSQINANSWAVSVRGFNTQFENKLLVLIDGRAVYTPVVGRVNLGFAGCSIGRHRPN
jgi:iron complex outermembrane recepter protein